MVYVSIAARLRLDVEALNMAESVGNYVRRRKVPVIVEAGDELRITYVPAISGESLAHAYQENLALIAQTMGLPVCDLCKRGIFLKHSTKEIFRSEGFDKIDNKNVKPEEIEEHVVNKCVVEDVGGFLFPTKPAKRTSRVMFGYMVPVRDALKAVAVEPQFHVRYDPRGEGESEQAIYNVEIATAVYGLRAELNVDEIGVWYAGLTDRRSVKDRDKRVEAAIKALALTIGNMQFGAKRSRFYPSDWEVLNAVAAVSHPIPFTVSSPRLPDYAERTKKRADSMIKFIGEETEKIVIGTYNLDLEGAENHDTFEDLMTWVLSKVKDMGKGE